jgi:hypothetical protein
VKQKLQNLTILSCFLSCWIAPQFVFLCVSVVDKTGRQALTLREAEIACPEIKNSSFKEPISRGASLPTT